MVGEVLIPPTLSISPLWPWEEEKALGRAVTCQALNKVVPWLKQVSVVPGIVKTVEEVRQANCDWDVFVIDLAAALFLISISEVTHSLLVHEGMYYMFMLLPQGYLGPLHLTDVIW